MISVINTITINDTGTITSVIFLITIMLVLDNAIVVELNTSILVKDNMVVLSEAVVYPLLWMIGSLSEIIIEQ